MNFSEEDLKKGLFALFGVKIRTAFWTSNHGILRCSCTPEEGKRDKMDDKKFLFWSRSIGDFALCVKGKVDALCGRPSFQAGIRLMRGGPSEVGKRELVLQLDIYISC